MSTKSVLAYIICIVGTWLSVSSCSDNSTADSREVAEQENIDKVTGDENTMVVINNDNDAKFLMDAAEMQLEEISLGKLAQQKGKSSHVKELGKRMEEDHSKAFVELKALAQSKSVSIPMTTTENSRDAYEALDSKTGNDFDKSYSDMMVEHHEDAIELFENASNESENGDIKTWASQKLPALRTHLKHAQECKEKCDKMD